MFQIFVVVVVVVVLLYAVSVIVCHSVMFLRVRLCVYACVRACVCVCVCVCVKIMPVNISFIVHFHRDNRSFVYLPVAQRQPITDDYKVLQLLQSGLREGRADTDVVPTEI